MMHGDGVFPAHLEKEKALGVYMFSLLYFVRVFPIGVAFLEMWML